MAGNFDLIRRKPEDVGSGQKAAERGARLASQLLAFSRAQKLELKPFDITTTVLGFGEVLQRSIEATIRLRMNFKTQDLCIGIGGPESCVKCTRRYA